MAQRFRIYLPLEALTACILRILLPKHKIYTHSIIGHYAKIGSAVCKNGSKQLEIFNDRDTPNSHTGVIKAQCIMIVRGHILPTCQPFYCIFVLSAEMTADHVHALYHIHNSIPTPLPREPVSSLTMYVQVDLAQNDKYTVILRSHVYVPSEINSQMTQHKQIVLKGTHSATGIGIIK